MNFDSQPVFLFKLACAAIGGFLTYMIGAENLAAFGAVAALGLIDTLMALYVAFKHGIRWKSKKFFNKPVKLAIYAMVIMAMHLLSTIDAKFGILVNGALIWAGASEALSIMENAAALGYKIPIPILKDLKKELND